MRLSALALIGWLVVGCAERAADEPAGAAGREQAAAGDSAGALPLEVVLADAAKEAHPGWKQTGLVGPRAQITRVRPAAPGEVDPPLPDAAPSAPPDEEPRPLLAADPGLKPPILRRAARYETVVGRPIQKPYVVLEVLVDTQGDVVDAVWVAGAEDSIIVDRVRRAALGMQFFPALLAGEPIQVWCRQRFTFRDR